METHCTKKSGYWLKKSKHWLTKTNTYVVKSGKTATCLYVYISVCANTNTGKIIKKLTITHMVTCFTKVLLTNN